MNERKTNLRAWVVGQSGSGKSHLTKNVILPAFPRVLVLDPMDEYRPHVEASASSPRAAQQWLVRKGAGHASMPFRLACTYLDEETALAYLRLAWALPDTLVVVEEVDALAWPSHSPRELKQIIQRGRHRRLSIVCSTQRPGSTPVHMRSQANLFVAFRLTTGRDVAAAEEFLGAEAQELPGLEVGEFRVSDRCNARTTWGVRY